MRHKYSTEALVLSRAPLAEAGLLLTLLTSEFGLIRARAEGCRRSGAKLAHALRTLCQSELTLVRGKEGWRITGAVAVHDRFSALAPSSRACIARVMSLMLRLVQGERADSELYERFTEFLESLSSLDEADTEAAESLIVLRLLRALGTDAGVPPPAGYDALALGHAKEHRTELIARINRDIVAASL